jgi:hypothetical protein
MQKLVMFAGLLRNSEDSTCFGTTFGLIGLKEKHENN